MLDHYLVMKARAGQAPALNAVLDRFVTGISGRLESVLDISVGENINQSGLARGYTHGCYVRLSDEAELMTRYWNHPAHQQLLAEIETVCSDRFAIDFAREA
jgi:hypothetical protein